MSLTIVTPDKHFVLEKAVFEKSETLANFYADMAVEQPYDLPNISSYIFSLIVDFLEHYKGQDVTPFDETMKTIDAMTEVVPEWDAKYVDDLVEGRPLVVVHGLTTKDTSVLTELVMASDYLHITPLTKLVCRKFALLVSKTKDVPETRALLRIEVDPSKADVDDEDDAVAGPPPAIATPMEESVPVEDCAGSESGESEDGA